MIFVYNHGTSKTNSTLHCKHACAMSYKFKHCSHVMTYLSIDKMIAAIGRLWLPITTLMLWAKCYVKFHTSARLHPHIDQRVITLVVQKEKPVNSQSRDARLILLCKEQWEWWNVPVFYNQQQSEPYVFNETTVAMCDAKANDFVIYNFLTPMGV